VVGDFDSVSDLGLAAARRSGATIDRHPTAKDATDLELALDHAVALGPDRLVVLGGAGGRFDHVLAGALLLADERYAHVATEARFGPALVTVVRGERVLHGGKGDLLSLLPVFGPAHGVTTVGLGYALDDEDLLPGSSRGVSNVFDSLVASVAVREGVLLAVQP
jgi:thiamine pyrophosphokinase